jgi:hypothetical protein
VSLVRQEQVGPFMQQLREKYFKRLLADGTVAEGEMGDVRAWAFGASWGALGRRGKGPCVA